MRAFGLMSLVGVVVAACGGRAAGDDLPVDVGSGGGASAAGGQPAGGAGSTGFGGAGSTGFGGASSTGFGGAGSTGFGGAGSTGFGGASSTGFGGSDSMGSAGTFAFGGASTGFGGATGTGGNDGSGNGAYVAKYCSGYCSGYATNCPGAVRASQDTCAVNCMSTAASIMTGTCLEAFRAALGCGLRVASGGSCAQRQPILSKSCEKELTTLADCHLQLPGAEECKVSASLGMDGCYSESQCNAVDFITKCSTSASAGLTTCTCFVDGQESYSVSSKGPDCTLLNRMTCGPVLVF